jgi:hypothetical protein
MASFESIVAEPWERRAAALSQVLLLLALLVGVYTYAAIDRGLPLPSWSPVGQSRIVDKQEPVRPVVPETRTESA